MKRPSHYQEDLLQFRRNLAAETNLLRDWFADAHFTDNNPQIGFELEFQLLNQDFTLAHGNKQYISHCDNKQVVVEGHDSQFEFNSIFMPLKEGSIEKVFDNIKSLWDLCARTAKENDQVILTIGSYPYGGIEQFTKNNLTNEIRYHNIDDSLRNLRHSKPIDIDISNSDALKINLDSIAIIGSVDSLQLHLQLDPTRMVRYYNSAQVIAAPMVALSCNAPLLFSKHLWEETRIALFENLTMNPHDKGYSRAPFGDRYLQNSIIELFESNYDDYACLFPTPLDVPPEKMRHVCLHNSTIYRWNRPIIGFNQVGSPHIRIEHRPVSAGNSIEDMIANAAFYYGLLHALATQEIPPETMLPFSGAKDNFYRCSKHGLNTNVRWLNNSIISVANLILEELLPMAKIGLKQLGFSKEWVDHYLYLIAMRAQTGKTGSAWQIEYLNSHNHDVQEMLAAYHERQCQNLPIHKW